MTKTVEETYEVLYHYTTGTGLKGIIESQQLWATNIAYLNDAEEHTGFFDRRLPLLLGKAIRDSVAEHLKTVRGKKAVEESGGLEKVVEDQNQALLSAIRNITLKYNDPYVTSFCAPPEQDPDEGLLSQWRGYGPDGGYAIVFGTNDMKTLIELEYENFHYPFLTWGNVEYYDQDNDDKAGHPETLVWEKAVVDAVRNFVITQERDSFVPLLNPITALSCRHKHRGFREEKEVRLVALRAIEEVYDKEKIAGERRPQKCLHFRLANGMLIPYINLFGSELGAEKKILPIRKVIVGPHPDRMERRKAAEMLLRQNGMDVEVTVSEIPYIGR